jgi:hypothetical protein
MAEPVTTAPGETFSDIERRLLAEIQRRRAARTSDIPELAQVWMALAPSWTVSVARAAGFPGGELGDACTVLQRMAEERMCTEQVYSRLVVRGTSARPERQEPVFSMEAAVREEFLDRAEKDPGLGLDHLRNQLVLAGQGVLAADRQQAGVSRQMARWATMAALALDEGAAAAELKKTVAGLLGANRVGDALRWIEAARRVERFVGLKLSAAIEWAGRQLELAHRREDDERHLSHFYLRKTLLSAFTDLLSDGDEEHWALHLVGGGGVGKTMLVRYISARWNADRKCSTARVDFDYLNPGFPSREPGLLLTELAKDLRLNDQAGAAQSLFDSLDEKAGVLHERWNASGVTMQSADDALGDPTYLQILEQFAEAAALLPQPVVLLLDTCEELAKAQADGSVPDSVRMTFSTLESLHKRISELGVVFRVVFVGRRPLASEGADWDCPRTQLAARTYLRLTEVRGFSAEEADEFLGQEEVPPDLIAPILEYCRERGGESVFVRRAGTADAAGEEERFHPFDLARLAEWVRVEEGGLTAEMIPSYANHYVEARIVERISYPALQRLMPVITLLGRLDEPTLHEAGTAIGMPAKDFQVALEELRQQEWINVQRSGFFEVDRGLLPRLRAYYSSETKRAEINAFTARLVRYLQRLTREADFGTLDPAHFDAVLRLLEHRPRQAARWWQAVEERFARIGRWDWARSLTNRLLSEDGAVAQANPADSGERPESRLRAAVLATHAAAAIHLDTVPAVGWAWQEVAAKAAMHPTREGQWSLAVRSTAGQVAAPAAGAAHDPAQLGKLQTIIRSLARRKFDEQLTASCLAAIEAVVEREETSAESRLGDALSALTDLIDERCPELAALACSLKARMGRRASRGSTGADQQMAQVSLGPLCEPSADRPLDRLDRLREAMAICEAHQPARRDWLDWRPPADALARAKLEFIRAAYPSSLSPSRALAETGAWDRGQLRLPAPVTTVDGERLASAVLQLASAIGLPSVGELEPFRAAAADVSSFQATCRVHQVFPPLFAALCEISAARGETGQAMAEVAERGRKAEQTAASLEIVQEAERAALRISYRMRLRDEGLGINFGLSKSDRFDDWALLCGLAGLDGRRNTRTTFKPPPQLNLADGGRETWNHARWRGVQIAKRGQARRAVDWAVSTFAPSRTGPDAGFCEITTLLDTLEAIAVGRALGRRKTFFGITENDRPDVLDWAGRHPDQPAQALLLLLRSEALIGQAGQPDGSGARLTALAEQVGVRRAAEIALDEGQLLALRLPRQARPVLSHASEWFARSGDPAGDVLARICTAMAVCRAEGKSRELKPVIGDVEHSYEALQASLDAALPGWPELEAAADSPKGRLDRLAPTDWRPWLVRLIACLAYLKDAGGTRYRAAVRAWLVSHYGSQMEQGTALPAELDGWLPAQRKIRSWAWLSAGFGGAILANVFGTTAYPWIRHEARGAGVPLAVLAFYAVFYYVGGRGLYGFALSVGRITVQVKSPSSPRADTPNDVHVTIRRKLPLWFLLIANYFLLLIPALYAGVRRLLRRQEAVLSLERSEKYRRAAKRLPMRLRTSFRITRWSLRWFRFYRRTSVDLLVGRQPAWQCWEAMVAFNAGHVHDVCDLRLRFRRSVPGARRTVVARLDDITEIRCWTATPQAAEIARRGWSSLVGDDRFTVVSSESVSWRASPEQAISAAQVLHIIGSGVETASAIRLEVARPDASPAWSDGPDELGDHRRGELVSSEELLSLFPGVTLCILQAPPALADSRTSADRDQAGKLRQLGAELFKLGVPFVLTVPPLPLAIGAAVIDEMAAVLRKGHRRSVDLLDAVAAGQADLGDWSAADPETRLEAALDICLYAPQP